MQRPKNAFKNAAKNIKAAAIGISADEKRPPMDPKIAKLKPTF
jgi:hypothetical protein